MEAPVHHASGDYTHYEAPIVHHSAYDSEFPHLEKAYAHESAYTHELTPHETYHGFPEHETASTHTFEHGYHEGAYPTVHYETIKYAPDAYPVHGAQVPVHYVAPSQEHHQTYSHEAEYLHNVYPHHEIQQVNDYEGYGHSYYPEEHFESAHSAVHPTEYHQYQDGLGQGCRYVDEQHCWPPHQ